jgi:hypothetical protein
LNGRFLGGLSPETLGALRIADLSVMRVWEMHACVRFVHMGVRCIG